MKNKKLFGTLMIIVFSIIFFFAFTSFVAFLSYLRPSKFLSDITPEDLGLRYEQVSFQTLDNLTLQGWFIPHSNPETAKTIVALHGWPADKGNILPFLSYLNQTYNLFLFDFRYLGQSKGRYSTIGAKETEDLKAALQYLRSRGIEEVGVWGFSMGGAVALMTAPNNPEIRAVVSEASYASLDRMASEAFRIPLLKYPLGFTINLWAKIFFGISLPDVAPVLSAKQLQIPILLIHSTTDRVIPFSHAQLLKEALKDNPKAEFWFQEGLSHGQFASEYQQRIQDFFDTNL
ncbi:alpha/beta fold hydrolase [Patescibacteria group bacterium]|nr:alpha/beta fold hydrolase [Patescibacteria group bacterium]